MTRCITRCNPRSPGQQGQAQEKIISHSPEFSEFIVNDATEKIRSIVISQVKQNLQTQWRLGNIKYIKIIHRES